MTDSRLSLRIQQMCASALMLGCLFAFLDEQLPWWVRLAAVGLLAAARSFQRDIAKELIPHKGKATDREKRWAFWSDTVGFSLMYLLFAALVFPPRTAFAWTVIGGGAALLAVMIYAIWLSVYQDTTSIADGPTGTEATASSKEDPSIGSGPGFGAWKASDEVKAPNQPPQSTPHKQHG